ncbi:MAG TPA: SdrD B-like domain-containing protein, partial [Tepidisphaeraceae bacterium]|nr:SdrD B-like domain-containing protein [Tepidisphaeraceae bacterium]
TPTPGAITGIVYNDQNGDGIRQAGEPGLSGWTVFIDQNANSTLDAGEPSTVTDASGVYTLSNLAVGANQLTEIPQVGFSATAPGTGTQLVSVPNGTTVAGINFGNKQRTDAGIGGTAFDDVNHNGVRDLGERGLAGLSVYLDLNNNGALDAGEPSLVTSADQFFTPAVDEAGTYLFTHLPAGTYTVRETLPVELSATPAAVATQTITLAPGELRSNVNFADVFRAGEIHGAKFDDLNGNRRQDPGEPPMAGVTVYLDLNRNDQLDAGEPSTVTAADGSYAFTGLTPGAYVVRELLPHGHEHTYPATLPGGILWPDGVSNPAVGNVSPTSITTSLAEGETFSQPVSLTLPAGGALTNKADVFLLFDDTGSFTGNSPIVRAAFPQIINSLQTALPGLDLGFGVGRFEEYGNFAAEFATGRPFILNQSIVSQTTPGFSTSIQSALDRTTPGYGGDQPETDIEALFQMVTGAGFDGNNNGTTTDSGAAGLVSTQLAPGGSGDVPSFASYTADATGNVLPAEGNIGGAGFRAEALPIILLATDTGFAYQPKGETSITGLGGLTLPISQLTQTSRPTTPFNSGAGIQETITGLNALGALVIGLGTNSQTNIDPRQQLESIARLTGAL